MIPRRVCVRGFLCYREEQEVDFEGSSLWMLAGLNGSGKSAVFDAVTYALFGYHRGGSQNAVELINKESDGFQVEFDFALDGELYRAKRTLRKTNRGTTTATQNLFRYAAQVSSAKSAGNWQPIPDTSRKTEFDAWVREHVGLTYETFTSSVLLLQGRAEKLLDATAKGRFEVLAGIVDLERFARLHAVADERRKTLKVQAESLQLQINALPNVTDADLAITNENVAAAEARLAAARNIIGELQDKLFLCRKWSELQVRAANCNQRWQAAQKLTADAAAIERDAERYKELLAVVPHLETIIKHRGQIAESERKSQGIVERQELLCDRLRECETALSQTHLKRQSLQATMASTETQQRELQARLRSLERTRAQYLVLEKQKQELQRHESELSRLPPDIERQWTDLQAEHGELNHLAVALPLLARLAQSREELRRVQPEARRWEAEQRVIQSAGEKLNVQLAALAPRLEKLATERQQADETASAAAALSDQALREEREFRELEGARVCRQCGQEVSAAHFGREIAKRKSDAAEAQARLAAARDLQRTVRDAEAQLRREFESVEADRQNRRTEFVEAKRRFEQTTHDVDRLERDCGSIFSELTEPFRKQIASVPPTDWAATVEPTSESIGLLRQRLARLDTVRRQLPRTQQQYLAWTALVSQVQTIRNALDALAAELPADSADIYRDFALAEADIHAVEKSLEAARKADHDAQQELDRLASDKQDLDTELTKLAGRLQTESLTRQFAQNSIDTILASIPESWRDRARHAKLADLHAWKTECDALAGLAVEQRASALQQARIELQALTLTKDDVARESEAIPEDARRPMYEVEQELDDARKNGEAVEVDVQKARQAKTLLESRQQEWAVLSQNLLTINGDLARTTRLAQLLGRDRLQLHLVRTAERQIVDHANSVLDRISGGQLYLRIKPGDAGQEPDRALELEAFNRVIGNTPVNVSFLSGSQRFRVAVSLALGIGQYASRQHRPIESVIIDEGFGSLDRNGRQVMIQELHNLRAHLKCILLVSHQDEFAEAFNNGYRFELVEGTTQVQRLTR